MALSRLARYLGEKDVAFQCLPVRATRLSKIFVASDITTLLIQMAGAGAAAGAFEKPELAKTGGKVSGA